LPRETFAFDKAEAPSRSRPPRVKHAKVYHIFQLEKRFIQASLRG
jgi:hypothetical protein